MWVSAVKLIIAAGEVGRSVTQQAYNHLDPLREHVHPFFKRREGMPKARCSCSFQPAPTPNTSRPPLRVSTAVAIHASKDGCRKVIGDTSDPNRSRVVSAAVSVNTTHVSSASRLLSTIDMKWSEHQSDSKPNSSTRHDAPPQVPRQPILTFEHHPKLHVRPPVCRLLA